MCTTLNYIECFRISPFAVTACISILLFASLVAIPIGITSSSIGLKFAQKRRNQKLQIINSGKTYKKNYKIILLVREKLNNLEVLISKFLNRKFKNLNSYSKI